MTKDAILPRELAASLRDMAQGLEVIAGAVRNDAAGATTAIRALEQVADETGDLASALASATADIETALAEHAKLLDATARSTDLSLRVVADLMAAARGVAALSVAIGDIAGRSRMLALNARIEAARAGRESFGFHVLANEVSELARSTLVATGDIESATGDIMAGAEKTRSSFEAVDAFVARDRAMLGDIVQAAARQRDIATEVSALKERSRSRIEDSAAMIGRLGSSAATITAVVGQLLRLADQVEATT